MNLRDGATLGRAALRSVRYLLAGDIEFPEGRLQDTIETEDGTTFVVYRETVRRSAESDASEDGVVLVFRMRVTDPAARGPFRSALFDPIANVATPFFAGLPGFRRKLWLAGERPGEFLELYEWASEADARRFVDAFRSLIEPVDHAGTVEFDVVPHDSVEEYVDAGRAGWRDAPPEANRPPRRTAVITGAVAVGLAIAAGYALRKLRRSPSG
ncbi:hypothetical protein C471_13526 [Halorubrum saccharovorum DSM 1137]|uniref:Uncharacterized protein n=1 Tax=Halorubrum saccharovorum DSM 1137 TaxID=1227484 RepID=M0DNM0_9EURY|nr:hypothetical protein [Halorubrum saccharovorum]ELZ37086.1 hypothetical protein C471_13526 [Halorubrum saccharovorum DSM 1137]